MEWLLLATGFSGGLTAVFLGRFLYRWWTKPLTVSVCFSPRGGCTEAVVREIRRATQEVLVHATAFNAPPIAQGLVDAKGRGLHVEVLLDAGNEPTASATLLELLGDGITPLVDSEHETQNQVIIIDGQTVITGSFPFTMEGEADTAANIVIIEGEAEMARSFRQHFLEHKAHSQPARRKTTTIAAAPQLPADRKAA
jgi:phosphatidylserine/phosphatidylglycerophosphate/cardiolipin synthase-like enzyme